MTDKTEPLLRADQVAERLNVPERTVLRYAQNGTLPSVRVAGIVRFKREEIERVIEESSVPSTLLGVVYPEDPKTAKGDI